MTIADLNAERGEALQAAELNGRFVEADVTDEAAVSAAVQAAEGLRLAVPAPASAGPSAP